jgi:hypothetical protein
MNPKFAPLGFPKKQNDPEPPQPAGICTEKKKGNAASLEALSLD